MYAIDTINAIEEKNQDEDECDLEAVLYLGYDWVFGEEGKHFPFDGKGHRDDEQHEERHLCYEEQEDESIVERHG